MKSLYKKTCALVGFGLLLATGYADAAVLGPGQSMVSGQTLPSSGGKYFAALQPDGDFAVFRADGSRVWHTDTQGKGVITANMQRDGNFVLYDASGNAVWSTGTRGRHRMLGVGNWGSLVVLNARKWKPRDKRAEPFVEEAMRRRAKLEWQSPSSEPSLRARQKTNAEAEARRIRGTKASKDPQH